MYYKNAVMDFLLSLYPDLLKIKNKYPYNSVLNGDLFYIPRMEFTVL